MAEEALARRPEEDKLVLSSGSEMLHKHLVVRESEVLNEKLYSLFKDLANMWHSLKEDHLQKLEPEAREVLKRNIYERCVRFKRRFVVVNVLVAGGIAAAWLLVHPGLLLAYVIQGAINVMITDESEALKYPSVYRALQRKNQELAQLTQTEKGKEETA